MSPAARSSGSGSTTLSLDDQYDYAHLYRVLTASSEAVEPPPQGLNLGDLHPLDWTAFIGRNESKHVGGGGFADVWEGFWKRESFPSIELTRDLPRVVVKKFRPNKAGMKGKLVLKEISVWHRLNHKNVARFVGILDDKSWAPCLISEYMERGAVIPYLHAEPDVCIMKLIAGICAGLKYLHDFKPTVVHGDIKPDNIVVKNDGQPCLCDFGLSRILVASSFWDTSAKEARGTLRWMAPELLTSQEIRATTASDVYAFALCCFELITGELPLKDFQQDFQIVFAIASKTIREPEWPTGLDMPPQAKKVIRIGWSIQPAFRPSLSMVMKALSSNCCKDKSKKQCIANPFKDINDGAPEPNVSDGAQQPDDPPTADEHSDEDGFGDFC